MASYSYTLIDPQNGNLAFKVISLDDHPPMNEVQKLNYYSILLVTEGKGKLQADFSAYPFGEKSLMCFAPYQPFSLEVEKVKGFVIHFHPDFFCIHKHPREVACNGILFNNIYQPPFHTLQPAVVEKLLTTIGDMQEELRQEGLAQQELLVSLLKIFLITATRSMSEVSQIPVLLPEGGGEPFVLQKLKDAIEAHYRSKHAAGEYAEMLSMSPKALGRMTKQHFQRTLTDMIAERIVIEAKRELYLSSKPVKAIAAELGFDDEYHFNRFFKNKADISPGKYRDRVGFGRNG